MPVVGGRRYITSTAVFLNEVIKLAICLTVALYEVSKTIPPSMPATTLFTNLSSVVFTGDSWKLAVPAALYTLSNSLTYVGLSNLEAATFQVTYQLKLVITAVFGAMLLRRSLSLGKWLALLLLLAGVFIVHIPHTDPNDFDPNHAHLHFPRSLDEWRHLRSVNRNMLRKRSATYEGIEEDLMLGHPHMNSNIGLLATIGSCIASGLAGVSFEKVLKDSASSTTSVWIRNVQLAIYSIFPSLFIGVVFLDGEKVARGGFFEGYNWVVWAVIGVQAVGGIATSFAISRGEHGLRNSAAGISILLSVLGAMWEFEFRVGGNFLLGTTLVLAVIYIYSQLPHQTNTHPHSPSPSPSPPHSHSHSHPYTKHTHTGPSPIRINNLGKLSGFANYSNSNISPSNPSTDAAKDGNNNNNNNDNINHGLTVSGTLLSPPNDLSIKLPTTRGLSESAALATSRPGSPNPAGHATRLKGSYFAQRGGG
ncbi:hypothetical protein PABG_04446 [Paracoccidioides brasiliensis Pb03]|nr:hypothetical protein PABG_04446 [Paracoccidioides brasiliensis Pb03]